MRLFAGHVVSYILPAAHIAASCSQPSQQTQLWTFTSPFPKMLSYNQNPVPIISAQALPQVVPSSNTIDHSMATKPSNVHSGDMAGVNGAPLAVEEEERHIWIITGPAGCGKSTIAQFLAAQLDMPYVEGDEFHPPSNIAKMSNGVPLTDADRWDWLIALRRESVASLNGRHAGSRGVVLTCSALKEKYRDVIRVAAYNDRRVRVRFVYLRADEDVLLKRVAARQGHYMKDDMIKSQFRDLEEPRPWELESDCLIVDVGTGSLQEVQQSALTVVRAAMKEHGQAN